MTENGLIPYDLAGNWCEECGRPKMNRLFGMLTGCKACDDVVTAHRCTKRPDEAGDREIGTEWECPDCGTVWVVAEQLDACPECGRGDMVKAWEVLKTGDRLSTAPRRKPQPWTPFRNMLRESSMALLAGPLPKPALPDSCYRMASGAMVHVRPGCRC